MVGQLDPPEAFHAFPRIGDVDEEPGQPAPVGATHEEQTAPRVSPHLVAETALDLIGEPAAEERVASPEPPVLDQVPAVDPACGRAQRLAVLAGKVGTERSTFRHPRPG